MAEGPRFEPLDVAKVSPFIVENHELLGFLLIPWLLSSSVVCEDFEHKFAQHIGVTPSGETRWID